MLPRPPAAPPAATRAAPLRARAAPLRSLYNRVPADQRRKIPGIRTYVWGCRDDAARAAQLAQAGAADGAADADLSSLADLDLPVLDRLYPLAAAKAKEDLEFRDRARKATAELQKAAGGRKATRFVNIPKLDDANWAGTHRSHDCTLIITEGDSAKALAIAGLSVVGRNAFLRKALLYPTTSQLLYMA